MTIASYELYGRRIRSNVPLGVPMPCEPARVDLDLQVSAPSLTPTGTDKPPGRLVIGRDGAFNVAVTEGPDGYWMRVRGLADIRINAALDAAVCLPGPDLGTQGFRDLATTVLSCWMVLCGRAVFHASAVTRVPSLEPSATVAFTGHSGVGKSTWAALMYNLGAAVVTDDALPLGSVEGRPVVEGGCQELRMRQFAGSTLRLMSDVARRETADGRLALAAGEPISYPLPLSSVVVLERDDDVAEPLVSDLAPRAAVTKLAGAHRVAGMRSPAAQVVHFERVSDVARTTPVLLARVPTAVPPRTEWAERLHAELVARTK